MTSESNAALWTVFQNSPQSTFILTVQPAQELIASASSPSDLCLCFQIVAVNPACAQLLSISQEELLQTDLDQSFPQSIANATKSYASQCIELRQPVAYKVTVAAERPLSLQVNLFPVIASDGTVQQIVGVLQDISSQRQLQQEAQLLRSITVAIATAHDFNTALNAALQQICLATGWTFAEAWIPDADNTLLECCPAWYAHPQQRLTFASFRQASQEMTFASGEGLPGRVWQTKKPEWVQDVSQSRQGFLRHSIANDMGLKAGLAVPIIARNQVMAVLSFFMAESRTEDHALVKMVTTVAAQLEAVFQLKRAEAALVESERRLAALINSLPGIAFSGSNDPEWTMSYLSEGCLELTGYRSEELTGKQRLVSYSSICHPDDLPLIGEAIEQAIKLGEPYVIEYRIHTKTGQEKWVWEKGRGLYDGMGNSVSLEGFITDITEIKQTEKALREQESFLRLVLDSMPVSIFWKDVNLKYLGCNKHLADFLGLSSVEEIVGKTDYDLLYNHPEAALYQEQDRRVIAAGSAEFYFLEQKPCSDNREMWVNVSKAPMRNLEGEVIGILGAIEDVTERYRAENALRQAEQKYRSIFENAVEGIFQTTPTGCYLTANSMLAKIYGYDSPDELMSTLTDIGHQLYVDGQRRQEFMQLVQEVDAVWGFESQIYRKDGSVIWISENARTIRDEQGQLLGYEGTVENITKRKQAEAELHKRDALLQGTSEATSHLVTHINFEAAIAQALATLGKAAAVDRVYIYQTHPHSITGEPAMSMRYEWVRESVTPSITQPHWQDQPYAAFGMSRWYEALSEGRSIYGITREFPTTEQVILGLDNILAILLVPILIEGEFWGFIGFDDCQIGRQWSKNEESILVAMAASIGGALKRQQAEATIRYQAFHDLLTGLPNRMLFNDRLPLALANANRRNSMLAVMFLDLDRFKTINDTLGHSIGDQLLQAVAQRLLSCLREGDTISRWGGDEFTILLPQLDCVEDVAKTAQRIIETLKPAFHLEAHELYISSSIGIALYPHDGEDAQTLLKNADAALYRVKEQGRNDYQIYTPAINSKATELLALENSLHHALERNQFVLHYQPQVNIHTWDITCMEALVRWHHPELGLISPRMFIPLAEENGLIVAIGEWVLRSACAQNKAWQDAGLMPLRVAVNLSARQFQAPQLVETVSHILADTKLESHYLELEITETTAMQNIEFATSMLKELQTMGVHISMDDFGTGYSSLGYLKKFPLHAIKIDQSFVQELASDANDAAIVNAVMALGHGLKLSVVAEGVETREQLNHLRSLNCVEMQGYLFSQPLPAEEVAHLLQKSHLKTLFTVLQDEPLLKIQSA